ncbi:MAG TPA: BREX-1 system adenine-specific DNA-methyltransferase PglX, partial [Pseudobdellovibrionaceae bacterium]
MFLSSLQSLRERILRQNTLLSMAHLGANAFDSISGEIVSTTAFVLENANQPTYQGNYLRLIDGSSESEKENAIHEALKNPACGWNYRASAADFNKIPGSPIAYWLSNGALKAFEEGTPFENAAPTRKGMVTARNAVYVRDWHEVSINRSGLDKFASREEAKDSGKKWFSYLKGGGFRRWYGNKFNLVNWENDGYLLQNTRHPAEDRVWATNFNLDFIFNENVNWGAVASTGFSARISKRGELFDAGGSACFPTKVNTKSILAFLNSKVTGILLEALNPTLNFQAGNISDLPLTSALNNKSIIENSHAAIEQTKSDWNSYETSWDFTTLPLLNYEYFQPTLKTTYQKLRSRWLEMTLEMQRLEEENNRIFIEAYGLQNELTPEVRLGEITLTCNPHYRYGGDKSEENLEALLLADTMRELISYAVGCMFGRYALDKPGLILANQGETIEDYLRQVPEPSFPVDDDNVIPMLDGDWFTDDIAERFRKFLRVTFGEEHYEENLNFVQKALGKNGKARDIRDYFLKDFYN